MRKRRKEEEEEKRRARWTSMFRCSKCFITQFLFVARGSCSSCTSGSSWAHAAVAQSAASAHSGTRTAGEFQRHKGTPTNPPHHAPSCPPTQRLPSAGHGPALLPPGPYRQQDVPGWAGDAERAAGVRAGRRHRGAVAAAQGSPSVSASAAAPGREVALPAPS